MVLGIKWLEWYHFISNNEVRRQTNQPLLTEIIQERRLTLYRPNGRQCRRKADLDFLAFCVLEETTTGRPRMTWMKTVQNDIDSHGLSWTKACQPGPEPTSLEAVGNQWHYAVRTRSGASRRRRSRRRRRCDSDKRNNNNYRHNNSKRSE